MLQYVKPQDRNQKRLPVSGSSSFDAQVLFGALVEMTCVIVNIFIDQLDLPALGSAGIGSERVLRISESVKRYVESYYNYDFASTRLHEANAIREVIDGLVANGYVAERLASRLEELNDSLPQSNLLGEISKL